MNFTDITTWSVSKGIAKPKVPYLSSNDAYNIELLQKHNNLVDFAQQHTYATDAPDGSYSAYRFKEIDWQFMNVKFEWINCVNNDPSFSKSHGFSTRQFLPFVDQVKETQFEKDGGVMIPTKNITNMKEAESPKFGEWTKPGDYIKVKNCELIDIPSEAPFRVFHISSKEPKIGIYISENCPILYLNSSLVTVLPSPPKTL